MFNKKRGAFLPYSKKSKYIHKRRESPKNFHFLRIVPCSEYRGSTRKKYGKGTKCIIGRKKGTGNYAIQAVLIPKKKKS